MPVIIIYLEKCSTHMCSNEVPSVHFHTLWTRGLELHGIGRVWISRPKFEVSRSAILAIAKLETRIGYGSKLNHQGRKY